MPIKWIKASKKNQCFSHGIIFSAFEILNFSIISTIQPVDISHVQHTCNSNVALNTNTHVSVCSLHTYSCTSSYSRIVIQMTHNAKPISDSAHMQQLQCTCCNEILRFVFSCCRFWKCSSTQRFYCCKTSEYTLCGLNSKINNAWLCIQFLSCM